MDPNRWISDKNEPLNIHSEYNEYPDMQKACQIFSEAFHIPEENFILCNGAENAFRAAVLCLANPKTGRRVAIESPGWLLSAVICDSLDIPWTFYNYKSVYGHPDGHVQTFLEEKVEDAEVCYASYRQNNYICHMEPARSCKYQILDETYNLHHLTHYESLPENTIVIGTFSKCLGPGLRLGYCIFPDHLIDRMQVLREQYISQIAVNAILDEGFADKTKAFSKLVDDMQRHGTFPKGVIAWHPTYLSVTEEIQRKIGRDIPCVPFTSGKGRHRPSYYRYGLTKEGKFPDELLRAIM